MLRVSLFVFLASSLLVAISAFAPNKASTASPSALDMGWFDGLFGGGQTATASHILLKGPNADDQCEKIKVDIYKKAIGRADPSVGVDASKLMNAVSS